MVQKIRTILSYAALTLVLTVNTVSANLLVVNAAETVQESTDIHEESLQTDPPLTEDSEAESSDSEKKDDAADAESDQTDAIVEESDQTDTIAEESAQTDEQIPDNIAAETVNEESDDGSSDQQEIIAEPQTSEGSISDSVTTDDNEADSVEPANEATGGIFFKEDSVFYGADRLDRSDKRETLYLSSDEEILSAESSDENVAVVFRWSRDYVYLDLKAPGTTQITVTGQEGSKASCTVTVEDPGLVITNKEQSGSITSGEWIFSVDKGYGLTFTSSNPSVVGAYMDTRFDPSGKDCRLIPNKPGKADVIVEDYAGRTETVHVTITDALWSLEQHMMNAYISGLVGTIYIDTSDPRNMMDIGWTFTARSSDNNIVSVDGCYPDCVGLTLNNIGTAVITVTDKYGKEETCTIVVRPYPISFGDYKTVTYNTYHGNGIFQYKLNTMGDSIIKTVTSSNTKAVTVQRKKYEKSDEYYLEVTPVGFGSAVITATDQYNQKATMQVNVTQKYLDEKRFYNDLYRRSGVIWPSYGETQIRCYCPIVANVYTIFNGKRYNGILQSNGYYYIKGIPRLPAGTKFKVGFQKGKAVFLKDVTVQKTDGIHLPMKLSAQTYTGKALYPNVTITNGNIILKKGTDYTLTYTNNKNVGNGKVTIAFKGNYTGAKAVLFKINPPKTSLTKATIRKKDITVYWKKQAKQTTGYQIQYSTNKLFKKGNKAVTVSKTGTTSKKITGLKRKTLYYVRIRTFKKIGKTMYYSGWSASKKIKTK